MWALFFTFLWAVKKFSRRWWIYDTHRVGGTSVSLVLDTGANWIPDKNRIKFADHAWKLTVFELHVRDLDPITWSVTTCRCGQFHPWNLSRLQFFLHMVYKTWGNPDYWASLIHKPRTAYFFIKPKTINLMTRIHPMITALLRLLHQVKKFISILNWYWVVDDTHLKNQNLLCKNERPKPAQVRNLHHCHAQCLHNLLKHS